MRKLIHALLFLKRYKTGQVRVPEIDVIKPFIQPEYTCLDIGAHGGSWTLPLSRLVPKGQVVGFEALPYYADVLKILFTLLFKSNVTIVNTAISDHSGFLELAWKNADGSRLTGETHISGKGDDDLITIRVPTITLDEYVETNHLTNIGFIKIDVEGAEMMVFKGATKTLSANRPVLFCEVDEKWTTRYGYHVEDVFDHFTALDYVAYIIDQQTLDVEATNRTTYSKHGDVLFIPSEKDPFSRRA